MGKRMFKFLTLSVGLIAVLPAQAFAQSVIQSVIQSAACRDAASLACLTAFFDAANTASEQKKFREAEQLLTDLLKRPDMSRPANEERRGLALQSLAIVRFQSQNLEGAKEAGRAALAIWQRRANPADLVNRFITHLNLTNTLTISEDFGEAETLARQLLTDLGAPRADTGPLRMAVLEALSSILAGRKAPISELVRSRSELVDLHRSAPSQTDDPMMYRLQLARALGNLADAQTVAEQIEAATTSFTEAEALLISLSLPDSSSELVLLRARLLSVLNIKEDRCGVEAIAKRVLPFAEPLGDRMLSVILMQHGENYRRHGASSLAAPLWARVTALELGMACPTVVGRRGSGAALCVGSPVLIVHLRSLGMSLHYERQGRATAGYRSLVQAGDLLRARTLGGFTLNRDASNAYSTNRDIFRDQVTTAWAINDLSAAPKAVAIAWSCPPR
jgi:hypothetical protein